MEQETVGKRVVEELAEIYKQLFVAPCEGGREKYSEIVLSGGEPEKRDLSHFVTSDKDRLEYADTPAGKVLCITLYERKDFVTCIRIMGHRCELADIPDTQGASILDGVINWTKINRHKEEFFEEAAKNGIKEPDWDDEFRRFTSDKKNFKDALIILSAGPYSNIPASSVGLSEEEWKKHSYMIRKFHECTHFICRRTFPEKIDAIWDELVADAVGIYGAFDSFDPEMEKKFLGIEGDRYIGGRLENYVEADTDEEKMKTLAELSVKISKVLESFSKIFADNKNASPFDMAVILEKDKDDLWS